MWARTGKGMMWNWTESEVKLNSLNSHQTELVSNWTKYGLELDENGSEMGLNWIKSGYHLEEMWAITRIELVWNRTRNKLTLIWVWAKSNQNLFKSWDKPGRKWPKDMSQSHDPKLLLWGATKVYQWWQNIYYLL